MVRKVTTYEASDGKQFKTKRGAENHEKRLAAQEVMDKLSMTDKEISEKLHEIASRNATISGLLKHVDSDWKKWHINLIRQINHDLFKDPDKKTIYLLDGAKIATETGDKFADVEKHNADKYEVVKIKDVDEFTKEVHLDYKKTWEERTYDKLMNGESLSSQEIRRMAFELPEVYEVEGEDGRWERYMTTVVELMGKHFAIYWGKGLTEMQEDSFYTQPEEVIVEEKEVTVTKTFITPVNK